jgi:hypothetical protein
MYLKHSDAAAVGGGDGCQMNERVLQRARHLLNTSSSVNGPMMRSRICRSSQVQSSWREGGVGHLLHSGQLQGCRRRVMVMQAQR